MTKTEEPKNVPPHPRLRKPKKGSHDYASEWHTESEHTSHGQGSHLKRHKRPEDDEED